MAQGTNVNDARREFLKKFASGVFASLLLPGISKKFSVQAKSSESRVTEKVLPALPEPSPEEGHIIRMMRDLQRALKKPLEQRKWTM
ncbi:MAG: (4Fe-4S)-binding protein, partial [Calditrichaeota bacterium]